MQILITFGVLNVLAICARQKASTDLNSLLSVGNCLTISAELKILSRYSQLCCTAIHVSIISDVLDKFYSQISIAASKYFLNGEKLID